MGTAGQASAGEGGRSRSARRQRSGQCCAQAAAAAAAAGQAPRAPLPSHPPEISPSSGLRSRRRSFSSSSLSSSSLSSSRFRALRRGRAAPRVLAAAGGTDGCPAPGPRAAASPPPPRAAAPAHRSSAPRALRSRAAFSSSIALFLAASCGRGREGSQTTGSARQPRGLTRAPACAPCSLRSRDRGARRRRRTSRSSRPLLDRPTRLAALAPASAALASCGGVPAGVEIEEGEVAQRAEVPQHSRPSPQPLQYSARSQV